MVSEPLIDFAKSHAQPPPLARATDPVTSHVAARRVVASGVWDSQKNQIRHALATALRDRIYPPTSRELATFAAMDRYTVARRLPDLEKEGRVEKAGKRVCTISGTPAVTWRLPL